ncbi:DNA-J related domain-containing protein [Gilvimarinus agarilyticus]|uniref:DNA-J related domain-containing protein n=1 Tax=Gilvimarinus agarilyticus TaxID=679259 RepID=UPI0006967A0C|nr:DNA-J related domain-containing protein [Gilvimarinus agarilyticus]
METNPLLEPLSLLLNEPGQEYSEQSLIKHLVAQELLPGNYGSNSLLLFQTHFALFNALYLWRDELHGQGLDLDIGLLDVKVRALEQATGQAVAGTRESKLREYYLNWSHFHVATEQSVEDLLNDFWQQVAAKPVNSGEREQALRVLSLTAPVTIAEVKQRYRRLAMAQHPDRGGDTEQLQEINWAMAVLRRGVASDGFV